MLDELKLSDTSPMPFGKREGTPIGQVPAKYLDWLRGQPWLEKRYPYIAEYIERNAVVIDSELKREGFYD